MSKYTPNGFSIKQIKKDSKKLKKELNISLSEARNIIIKKYTDFKSWEDLQHYFKKNDCVDHVLKYKDSNNENQKINIYKDKPVVVVYGFPGTGKSFEVKAILEKENPEKILMVNIENANKMIPYNCLKIKNFIPHDKSVLGENIEKKEKSLLEIINNKLKEKEYKILVIDEFQRLSIKEEYLIDLLNYCKKKNIVIITSTQVLKDTTILKDHSSVMIEMKYDKIERKIKKNIIYIN